MAGKYVAYSEYKDSGVEWLGEIPSAWNVCRVKNIAELNPSKSELKNQPDDYLVSFLPMETIGEQGELDCTRVKKLSDVIGGYTYLADGDAFVAKITPCFENGKGAVAKDLVNGVGFATTEVIPLRPFQKGDSQFIYYLLHCDPFMALAEGSMYGAGGQKRVADSFVAEYHLALPELSERSAIANFLDHETAKIDTLIEEQKTLIRLLQEKRQAVISHAVTKGLNPDAPMKDSGVEWLGEVPEHWEVIKLKHLIEKMDQGWSPQCDSRPAESHEYGVLKVGCVNGGFFTPNENKALPPELPPRFEYLLQKGQLLISRANTKELVGSAAVVDREYPNLLLCDKLYRLTLTTGISIEFIKLLLGASVYRKQIELGATGASSSMQNIAQDIIKELSIALPENEEVDEILCYVDLSITKYDQLIKEAGSAISYMQERRTALISAAVTGKIDVRDWAAPKPIVARQQEQQTTEAVE